MSYIEHSTGFLVVRTARSLRKALDLRFAEKGITATQFMVLDVLQQEGNLPLSEIGKKIYLDKPAVTGLADRLEKEGFVERKRSLNDRRVVNLHITDRGKAIHDELEPLVVAVDQDCTRILSGEELTAFRTTLNRIWNHTNGSLES